MNKSLSSTALTWYKYTGSKFVVMNNTQREQISEGSVIGIRPIARSEDYYLALRSAPEKLYRINGKRARVIAQKSKAVRVVVGKPELTKEAKEVVEAATGSRLNSERFKPLVPPRNELKTEGVKTSNYQWRVVKDSLMEVDTNKTGRTISMKRGDIFGIRFVLPTQGGKLVMLDGTYESIPTSQYDSLVQQTPLLPLPRWPDTVISPELIQEYRDRLQKKRIAARHEREREERAQDAAVNNARKAADRKAKDQERVVRVNDGKENAEIAKLVTDAARAEAAKLQEKIEERKRNAGLKDEDLRRMKEASGKKPFSKALDVKDADDEDFGEDLADNIETRNSGAVQPSGVGAAQKKLEVRAQQLADLYSSVQKTYRSKIKDPEELSAQLTDIRAQYVEDVTKMRSGDEGIIEAWEQLLSDAEAYSDKENKPAEQKTVKGGKAPKSDDEIPDDPEDEDVTDEEEPDATDEEEVADDFEEEDGDEPTEEEVDEEEVDDNSDSDEEEVDDTDESDEEDGDGSQIEEDFDPAEMAAQEDSDGISRELAGNEVEEEVDDLSEVDEEDDTPPAPVKKKEKPSKEKPAPASDDEEVDEEIDPESDEEVDPEDDEDVEEVDPEDDDVVEEENDSIDDVDEENESDENADDDLPQAAGVKSGNVDSDEGDIIVFHDDTKQKRKYAIIQIAPNAKDDRILEYTVWDTDGKPESYKVVRINTGRKQHITDMADKVGQLPPKQFNQIAEQVADYQYDKSPIRS